jgi:hypothetical protein
MRVAVGVVLERVDARVTAFAGVRDDVHRQRPAVRVESAASVARDAIDLQAPVVGVALGVVVAVGVGHDRPGRSDVDVVRLARLQLHLIGQVGDLEQRTRQVVIILIPFELLLPIGVADDRPLRRRMADGCFDRSDRMLPFAVRADGDLAGDRLVFLARSLVRTGPERNARQAYAVCGERLPQARGGSMRGKA